MSHVNPRKRVYAFPFCLPQGVRSVFCVVQLQSLDNILMFPVKGRSILERSRNIQWWLFFDKYDNADYQEIFIKKRKSSACQLHYEQNPIKLTHSEGQYFYDDNGEKYLDCVTRIANVGHCHPKVIKAAKSQMETFNLYSKSNGSVQNQFCNDLLKTLPSNFEVCLFTNSGAEANDLALQLAKRYTENEGVAVLENAFHGSVLKAIEISPAALHKQNAAKMPWVHILPYPDTYRTSCSSKNELQITEDCFQEVKSVLDDAVKNGAKIGCFISETVLVVQGVIILPGNWLSKIYSYIHELGGVIISDEIQTGMGRCGTDFWAFQTQGVVPDIITVGKPIGNGYPIAAVVTSRSIARSIEGLHEEYMCCSVAAVIGKSVLNILEEERLMANAEDMGQKLREGLRILKDKHRWIGDVRGIGMIIGLEIVWCRESKKPAPEVASKICYRLREEHLLTENGGAYANVIVFMPPLCLSADDVLNILQILNKVLLEIEISESQDVFQLLRSHSGSSSSGSPFLWQESLEGVIESTSNYYSLD